MAMYLIQCIWNFWKSFDVEQIDVDLTQIRKMLIISLALLPKNEVWIKISYRFLTDKSFGSCKLQLSHFRQLSILLNFTKLIPLNRYKLHLEILISTDSNATCNDPSCIILPYLETLFPNSRSKRPTESTLVSRPRTCPGNWTNESNFRLEITAFGYELIVSRRESIAAIQRRCSSLAFIKYCNVISAVYCPTLVVARWQLHGQLVSRSG